MDRPDESLCEVLSLNAATLFKLLQKNGPLTVSQAESLSGLGRSSFYTALDQLISSKKVSCVRTGQKKILSEYCLEAGSWVPQIVVLRDVENQWLYNEIQAAEGISITSLQENAKQAYNLSKNQLRRRLETLQKVGLVSLRHEPGRLNRPLYRSLPCHQKVGGAPVRGTDVDG